MSATPHRYKLTLAYDGAGFHGWQRQMGDDGEPLRTVQGALESAMRRLLKQPINVIGASRTDAGVHALGQVAHFDAACPIPIERLPHAINSRLPEDVDVRAAEVVADDFHAIKGAAEKQYRYRIFNSEHRPLDRRRHVWHCWWDLDVDRMNDAAGRLVGTHDFEGFAAAGHGRSSTVRTIFDCRVVADDPEVQVTMRGDGFLYNMVRIIGGTLVEIGRGLFEPDQIDEILRTADRRVAGPTLPPNGLWLEWIRYDEAGEASCESSTSSRD